MKEKIVIVCLCLACMLVEIYVDDPYLKYEAAVCLVIMFITTGW